MITTINNLNTILPKAKDPVGRENSLKKLQKLISYFRRNSYSTFKLLYVPLFLSIATFIDMTYTSSSHEKFFKRRVTRQASFLAAVSAGYCHQGIDSFFFFEIIYVVPQISI